MILPVLSPWPTSQDTLLPDSPAIPDLAAWLREYGTAIQQRQRGEEQWRDSSRLPDAHERSLRLRVQELTLQRDAVQQQLTSQHEALIAQVQNEFDSRLREMDQIHSAMLRQIESDAQSAQSQVEQQRGDSEWVVTSVMDDNAEDSPVRDFERVKLLLAKSQEEQAVELMVVSQATDDAAEKLSRARPTDFEFPPPQGTREQLQEQFTSAAHDVRVVLRTLDRLWIPKLLGGWNGMLFVMLLAAAIGAPAWAFLDPALLEFPNRQSPGWIGVTALSGVVASLLFTLILYSLSSMRQSDLLRQASSSVAEAGWLHQHWLKLAKDHLQARKQATDDLQRRIERDRHNALRRYEQAHLQRRQEIESQQAGRLKEEHTRFAGEHGSLQQERSIRLGEATRQYEQQVSQATEQSRQALELAEAELQQWVSQAQRARQQHWSQLKSTWERADRDFYSQVAELAEASRSRFPAWENLLNDNWEQPTEFPDRLRLGEAQVRLEDWDGAISSDMRLAPRVTEFALPVEVPFPQAASVIFLSPTADARREALRGMQSLMLRLLTQIPPGQLRFTIIDPVGLGESFSGFMHLTDFDEMLVTSRIWTEANQIEARLADLTEHMENVLQKYLRNEFQTIEEYNESAGEVAEPYHFLVIGDFPAKFSEIAARRLVSIVNSGPRCGVHTLINLDPTRQLPNSFALQDILPAMTSLQWREGAFHTGAAPLSKWPLRLETPPPPEQFTTLVRMVGEVSKDARKVQVSFDRITPSAGELWSRDSRSELVIPLGRAGATKLQEMRLGRGTSQHMLVAGKTGSGKSTFLHILITNLALFYGPDEVNFFLIDFKKGVEFKDYATLRLPHARVIAVESDREFGVSALQKLDEILQQRGELFRRHGVQDIAGYRQATSQPLPRILLVVDEFQEFFVEDDKLSQTAALLLDRLVRQGRAFGMHVILGSQTLGGAYSLARTTLGQVAVRVALQCSEADAHLILSEENTAARLLARPGEAIYNDANGMLEGNHPFQIAWISDQQRSQALRQIRQRAQRRGVELPDPVVFEGNIPSDLTANSALEKVIAEHHARRNSLPRPETWLGDAVEIGPPTSIVWQKQSGHNLLLVGPDPEAAQGVMTAIAIAAAASGKSSAPTTSPLLILDGSHPDSPEYDHWRAIVDALPTSVPLLAPAQSTTALTELTTELLRREAAGHADDPVLHVLIFNLSRFRDLRKVEDDFGMGSFGGEAKPAQPGQLFADLLSRGPAVGIHVVAWCDTFNNLERWLSRQSQKEMELRIAFQMNASDSSNLIDSPGAARLGTHRALFYREETGTSVKFRPYGLPPREWLQDLPRRLQNVESDEMPINLEDFRIL